MNTRINYKSFWIALIFLTPTFVWAQKTKYVSSVENQISVRSVLVFPFIDNTKGIYSGPLTSKLKSLMDSERQWNTVAGPERSNKGPEFFDENPSAVVDLYKKHSVDGVISGRISKGPSGLNLSLNLYVGKDGLLAARATLNDFKGFEIKELEHKVEQLWSNLKSRLPYAGMILSRKGQLVTINLGKSSGYKEGDEISVIQILKIERHPKFKFITGSEKEIFGKIKISKAEEFLSFATILSERESGVLISGMKLMPINFVQYNETPIDPTGKLQPALNDQTDGDMAFGDKPQEWVPDATPSFGKLGLMLGLGTFTNNNTLSTVGAMNSSSSATPSIHFDTELWLNPNWIANFQLHQYVYTLVNPYTGSSPAKLNGQSTEMSFNVGYNFLLEDKFFGPKLVFTMGWDQYKSTIDSSTPVALTALTLTGFNFGVSGQLPLSDDTPMDVGAGFNYFISSSVDESPVTSGSSNKPTMIRFQVFGDYRYSPRYSLKGVFFYDQNQVQFSGVGTRTDVGTSASHNFLTLAVGINYRF
jgi:hypothetical protein